MNKSKETLSEKISQTIEKEKIQPISKKVFVIRRIIVWCIVLLSVLISSATLSMILFRVSRFRQLPYEHLVSPIKNQIIDTVPWVSLVALIVGLFLAVYEFDKTNKGYKYAKTKITIYFITCIAILGTLFSYTGVHHVIHRSIVDRAKLAPSVEEIRNRRFNQPDRGSIVGIVRDNVLTNRSGVQIPLIQGNTLNLEDFSNIELQEQPVILFGNKSPDGFVVCTFNTHQRNREPQKRDNRHRGEFTEYCEKVIN